jgi:hypothetical protein
MILGVGGGWWCIVGGGRVWADVGFSHQLTAGHLVGPKPPSLMFERVHWRAALQPCDRPYALRRTAALVVCLCGGGVLFGWCAVSCLLVCWGVF